MKPGPFEYHAPTDPAEVLTLLAEHGDEAKVLAGGQSLVPMLALRLTAFPHLVDVNRVAELAGIEESSDAVGIGAMTRQATGERDESLARTAPLVAEAASQIGHFQIRNRGTIGGSIAHADPAAELPVVALTLDAELEVANTAGTRRVPAGDFFVGTWTTTLEPEDLLVRVWFPKRRPRSGFALEEVARRPGDFALAGAAVAIELGPDDTIAKASIGLLGMGSTPLRASTAEAALIGARGSSEELDEAGRLAAGDSEPHDDVHASRRYREHVGARLVARAVSRAVEEARND